MRFWFSPFPLEPTALKSLSDRGLQRSEDGRVPPAELLLLYEPPHAIAEPTHSTATVAALTHDYRHLIALTRAGAVAVGLPRFVGAGNEGIRRWLEQGTLPRPIPSLPDPSPTSALVTLAVLERHPALLKAYLDLELHADLLGGSVDSHYLERLRRVVGEVDPDHLLRQWQAPGQAVSRLAERTRLLEEALAERDTRIDALERECDGHRRSGDERLQDHERVRMLLDQCRIELEETAKERTALRADNAELGTRLAEQARELGDLRTECRAMANEIRQAHLDLEQAFLNGERAAELSRQCQMELRRAETLLLRPA